VMGGLQIEAELLLLVLDHRVGHVAIGDLGQRLRRRDLRISPGVVEELAETR